MIGLCTSPNHNGGPGRFFGVKGKILRRCISNATHFQWRSTYAGASVGGLNRLKS